MEYIGAADYYFWQGVAAGECLHEPWTPEQICPSFYMNNEVTRVCQEAFKWGYCLGRCLTKEEYRELTKYNRPVNVETNEKIVNLPTQGSC